MTTTIAASASSASVAAVVASASSVLKAAAEASASAASVISKADGVTEQPPVFKLVGALRWFGLRLRLRRGDPLVMPR